MNNLKEKSQVFIIGVMAGLIIAGSFFILKLDDYFKELNFYKQVSNTFSSQQKTNEVVVNEESITSHDKKNQKEQVRKSKKTMTTDTTIKTNYILNADSLNTLITKDSGRIGSNNTDEIIVRKDELLFTKTIDIINLNPIASSVISKDSLLQKISGVNDDKHNIKEFLNVEFWHSPLNYKGYKMSKYKLVLYGITSADGLKIFKSEDLIYLKNATVTYKLDHSSDFKPFERISDETIINKLK